MVMEEPCSIDAKWYTLALKHDDSRDVAQALVCLERYLRSNPLEKRALCKYAIILAEVRRFDEAEAILSVLLPEDREAGPWTLIGAWCHIYRLRGDFRRAESWGRKLCEARADWTGSYIYLGSCLARQGRLDEALEVYRMATGLPQTEDNDPEEVLCNIGLIHRAQGQFKEAASALLRAIEIDPENEGYRLYLRDVTAAMELQSQIETEERS